MFNFKETNRRGQPAHVSAKSYTTAQVLSEIPLHLRYCWQREWFSIRLALLFLRQDTGTKAFDTSLPSQRIRVILHQM